MTGIAVAATVTLGGVTAAQPAAAASYVDSMYRLSSRGDCVRYIQALDNFFGGKLAVDGVFGARTDAGVRALQTRFRLRADGVVGRQTWGILCRPQRGDAARPGLVPNSFPIWAARGAGCPGASDMYYGY